MVSFEQVIARIGHMPVGDPAAMRRHATLISTEADAIAQRANALTSTIAGTGYQCPAADRLRSGANDVHGRLIAAATRLKQLAADLNLCATRVEQEQGFWRHEFQRVEQTLERTVHH